MLTALTKHGRFDLEISPARSDLPRRRPPHHQIAHSAAGALDQASRPPRHTPLAHAYAPLDEALARVCGRPHGRPRPHVDLAQAPDDRDVAARISATSSIPGDRRPHGAACGLSQGENDHHRVEAAFKALALALKDAVAATANADIPPPGLL
jgi:imidazoleglycerol-phosphate dehydratase